MTPKKTSETEKPANAPQFDDVLKRMLSTPPDPKVKDKPADKIKPKPKEGKH